MPESYFPLQVKGRFGLNTRKREDSLDPGEATVASGCDLSRLTLGKRKGHRPLLIGEKDNVQKGPSPSQSLYVVGEEWWLDHDAHWLEAQGDDSPVIALPIVNQRREFHHARQGVIVIPEGDVSQLRLDVQSGDPDWAIEFEFWTDDLPYFLSRGTAASPGQISFDQVVIAKGRDSIYQWALRLIPDTGGSVNRIFAVLTLYEQSDLTLGVDFFFQSGADRAWIEPGKKIALGFQFTDGGGPIITSKYWIEGATAVSSSQPVGGTLRTNGTQHATTNATAMVVGRRARQQNRDVPATRRREMGFNGCLTELRFWAEDAISPAGTLTMPSNWFTVASDPPSATDWYVDREIPVEQLSTVDAGTLVQVADLKLYFQLKPELLGTDPTGASTGDGSHIIRPRFKAGGGTEPRAWVTGADAIWVPMSAGSKLGANALAFIPAGPTGQKHEYANTVRYLLAHHDGYRLFCAGVRVPNGERYLRKLTTSASSTSYEYADAYSVDLSFIVDALPSDTTDHAVLWELCAVRRGPVTLADYSVEAVLQVAIVFDTGQWRLRWLVTNNAGASQTIFSTTAIAEGVEHVAACAVRWETVGGVLRRVMALYLDGPQEATNTTSPSTKPFLSQTSDSESAGVGATTTDLNDDDKDGRDACYPMSIGYTCRTGQAAFSAPITPRSTLFGSQEQGVGDTDMGHRAYWAFHNNFTPKQPNDGVTYRGERGFSGRIGRLNIWKDKFVSESEHRRWVSRSPDEKEIAAFGGKLASSWDMEEGQGVYVRDRGAIGNDLRISPVPSVRVQTGALARAERPPLLGLWQLRKGGLDQQQSPEREIYALAGGCVHRIVEDDNGERLMDPIGRVLTPELYSPRARALRLPTAFSFQGVLYICTGLGAVKKIVDGVLMDAGVNPVFGAIGDEQTNPGWRELDRDGTFCISGLDEVGVPTSVTFAELGLYTWYVTHVDPRSGLESAPSRGMTYQCFNFGTSPGNGWFASFLRQLPHPIQRNVTRMRIYRTSKDGDLKLAKFVAEIDVSPTYLDATKDVDLKSTLDSWLNFPPPQNVNIGVVFGSRAFYTGDPGNPGRIWYSKNGTPGAVPPQYVIDLPEQITALLPSNGVLLAMSQHRVWAIRDSGGEVSFAGNEPLPVSVEPLRSDVGCISHHGAVLIEKIGWFFPSLRGFHLTDGYAFRYISPDIEPTYRELDFNKAHAFCSAHDEARQRIAFFCSSQDSPDDRNDQAIVWHYAGLQPETAAEIGRDGFSVWPNIGATFATTIEDNATGSERIVLCDFSGQLFEFDPPDADVNNDGVLSGPTSGTIRDRKLDPLGSGKFTRLRLVDDGSLPTEGLGLRGVRLYSSDANAVAWHGQPLIILSNDTDWVTVETAGAQTTDPTGFEWRLGAIPFDWTAGKDPLGSETLVKEVSFVSVKFGEPAEDADPCTLNIDVRYDEDTPSTGLLDPSKREDSFADVIGRGRRVQVRFYDTDLPGGRPDNPVEIQAYELAHWVEGRSSHVGSET